MCTGKMTRFCLIHHPLTLVFCFSVSAAINTLPKVSSSKSAGNHSRSVIRSRTVTRQLGVFSYGENNCGEATLGYKQTIISIPMLLI